VSRPRRSKIAVEVTRYPDEGDVLAADDQIGEAASLLAVIGSVDHNITHPKLSNGIYLLAREVERRLCRARELIAIKVKQ
jgi:hypothetical protein